MRDRAKTGDWCAVRGRRVPGRRRGRGRLKGLSRLAFLLLPAIASCGELPETRASLSVTRALAEGDTAGYARADTPRRFGFPADHGPHPAYRHEWWYYTGNLDGPDGRRFGFQLTFFRSALRPTPPDVDSDWATSQAYMAHFAVTDVARSRFRAFERFERGALGLAGARAEPFRVWVGDWSAEAVTPASPVGGTRLRAASEGVAIDVRLRPAKPPVLQGDQGLSRKGPEPGNASYYYSLTRLDVEGRVVVEGDTVPVAGVAWLDREWGTSALGPELVGWDWFALQLSDASELMVYRLRREDGGTDRFSAGSFVGADGRVTRLESDDVALRETGHWTSPRGPRYPSGWEIRIPSLDLALAVEPLVRDQELPLSFRYWEGAVGVRGERRGAPVAGRGYVELTGYDGAGDAARATAPRR